MAFNSVGRKPNQLNPSLCELWLESGKCPKFCCTDWCVVLRMGEQDDPFVANEPGGPQHLSPFTAPS